MSYDVVSWAKVRARNGFTLSTGRNGGFWTIGVNLVPVNGIGGPALDIIPVNSKGHLAAGCTISVPRDSKVLMELAGALIAVAGGGGCVMKTGDESLVGEVEGAKR